MYLSEDDFKLLIKEDRHEAVIENDPSILHKAILAAQSECESYLRSRFDMNTEMARIGDNRNPALVMYMTDMAIYHMVTRINPRNVPEHRQSRYDNAIDWLEASAKGSISPDLPPLSVDEPNGFRKYGSNPKQGHYY
jgi:phage gp36-like protein